jgi:chorismate mutase
MIDIENARALVETLKDYAEHPSSFTDISPTEADAAADLIDALLNEVERLNSPVVLSEWQKLVAERDALMSLIRDEIDENTRLRVLGGAAADEGITAFLERVIAERDALARDAARYRWLRQPNPLHREAHIAVLTHNGGWVASEEKADAAFAAAMKGASGE